MRKNSTYEEKRKAGFTLVELIVVLVMLSILTAVAVPTYMGYVDDNKAKQCETHRKALASRLEEMSAMGSTASLTEDEMNSAENGCPAGGKYTLNEQGNTIICDKHGETTVILKSSAGIVTADVNNVQTEAPKETDPSQTDPPQTDPPVIPSIDLSLESGSKVETKAAPDMEVEGSQTLNVYTTVNHCQDDTSYTWTESGGAAQIESGAGTSTVTIKAVSAGTSVFTCWATATSDVDNTTAVKSNSVTISVKVNEKSNLSISFASDSYFTIATTAPQSLQVNTNSTRCSDIEYFWTVTQGNEEAIHINSNRESATVTADQAGDYAISCQATARSDADGQLISSNTVTATIKVASLSLSIESDSGSEVEMGDTIHLTAKPDPKNCTVYNYNWWSEDSSILNITGGWGTNTVTVEAQKADTCKIYCIAESDFIKSNQADYQMTVKEKETESNKESNSLLGDLPEPFLINGGTGGIDIGDYEMVKPGQWYSSDPSIVSCPNNTDNKWLTAHQAGNVDLTYKVAGGQSQTVHAKVVYPHTFLNVNGQPDEGTLAYNGEVLTLTAVYGLVGSDKRSTDRPVEWVNLSENKDIISISTEGENNEIAKITANGIGTAKVMARLQNEYTKKWSEVPVEYTIYNRITGVSVEPASLELIEGETGEITIGYVPSGNLDTQGVTRHYSVNPSFGLTVETLGGGTSEILKVTGNTPGTYTLEVYAQKSGSIIGAKKTCTVVVNPDPKKLTGVYVVPDNVEIMEGQEVQIQMHPMPDTASLDGVEFTYSNYSSDRIAVDAQGKITAKSAGDPTTIKIASHQIEGDKWFADNYLTVKVIPDPNKPVLVEGSGVTFDATKWETLRAAIQSGKVNDIDLPLSNLYYVPDGNGKVSMENGSLVVYIRDKNKPLTWDSSFADDMSFADYLEKNEECFIKVTINPYYTQEITLQNGGYWGSGTRGSLIKYKDEYYVCVEAFNWTDISKWSENEMKTYFVKLSVN